MPRPRKADKLVRHTVMVPPRTKAAMVEAGADTVREVLVQLPPPTPMQTVLAVMETVGRAYTVANLTRATGLSDRSVWACLGTLCRTRQVIRDADGFRREH